MMGMVREKIVMEVFWLGVSLIVGSASPRVFPAGIPTLVACPSNMCFSHLTCFEPRHCHGKYPNVKPRFFASEAPETHVRSNKKLHPRHIRPPWRNTGSGHPVPRANFSRLKIIRMNDSRRGSWPLGNTRSKALSLLGRMVHPIDEIHNPKL
jgi:hypothetical protein